MWKKPPTAIFNVWRWWRHIWQPRCEQRWIEVCYISTYTAALSHVYGRGNSVSDERELWRNSTSFAIHPRPCYMRNTNTALVMKCIITVIQFTFPELFETRSFQTSGGPELLANWSERLPVPCTNSDTSSVSPLEGFVTTLHQSIHYLGSMEKRRLRKGLWRSCLGLFQVTSPYSSERTK